jgi:hypothetical protein
MTNGPKALAPTLALTMTRFADAYVTVLLALEVLLFAASLLLHVSVLAGARKPYAEYGVTLFRMQVVVGFPIIAFIKDGLKWMDQIKSCPKWMWKSAVSLGLYGLFIFCLQVIFPEGRSISEQALTVSGVPLGFDAIYSCILYSVLYAGYLDKSEVVRRALGSVIFIVLGVITFLAYRAGYLRRANSE